MNLLLTAGLTWCFCLGLVGSGWWWLAIILLISAATLFRLRVALVSIAPAGLLALFFCSIAAVSNRLISQSPNDLVLPNLNWLHQSALTNSIGITTDAKALVLGLSMGDDSLLSGATLSALKTVSLTHLSAVSGANCAIVIAAVYFLLGALRIRARVIAAITALLGYIALVGAQPSVLRAGFMASVVLLASASGRKVKPVVALALSVCCLLALDPQLVLSLSFVLSVAATAGLLWLTPLLYARFRVRLPKWLAATVSVSLAAQLFCAPILLQLQGGLPTYSLVANLLAEPLVAPITLIGLVAVLLSPLGLVSAPFFCVASVFAQLIVALANWLASLPFATLPWAADPFSILGLVALVLGVIVWASSKTMLARNLSVLLVAALSVGTLAVLMNRAVQFLTWPDPQWQVASCDVGQGDATVVRSENQIALIDTGKFDQKIDSCLSRLGVKRIELLVLTHFDLDHVAALHAAVQGRQVDLAMVTSFRDERPGADWVRQQLQLEQIPVVSAEAGMTGRLGAANWLVMNPPQAGDADDSNDGSIAMLFRLSGYNLIALADLGEHAQMRVAESMGQWFDSQFREQPLVMKVAHHGSADQYAEFIEALHPQVALISVGRNNGYGHPTARTLNLLGRVGALLARTDLLGSITLGATASSIAVAGGG